MANKHLTEDEIRYTVDVKTADAQKAIYNLEQQSKKLRSENKARLNQMISLEAAGRKESETYRNLKKQYSETIKETFGVKVPYWVDSLEKCIANLKQGC